MDSPFFRNHRWHQRPGPTRNPLSTTPSFRGVPVYHLDPTHETRRPVNSAQHPTERNPGTKVVHIPVHFVGSKKVDRTGSAVHIQKAFRGFFVRECFKKIKEIKALVDEIEEKLSKSEVVESVRRDEGERLRMSESLMSLLFKLDSICGIDLGIRGCRKAVIRKVIALQERIDAIISADFEGNGENVDQVTEDRVYVETDNPNASDQGVSATDSFPISGDSEESLEDVSCAKGGDDKSMEVEENDEEAEIIDVGVDCEVKVSKSNGSCAGGVLEGFDLVANRLEEGVKEKSLSEGDENSKRGGWIDGDNEVKAKKRRDETDKSGCRVDGENEEKANEGSGVDDNKRNRELLERMMEDNEKMMSMMTQLFERNEMQTRTLNALTRRIELLEKAFVCDRLRKKKKTTKVSAQ